MADLAGFLPWAMEDTINTRSVLGFWPMRVVPESSRVDARLLGRSKTSAEDGKKWKGQVTGRRLDEMWLDTTGVIVFRVGKIGQPSHSQARSTECTLPPAVKTRLMVLYVYIHEATRRRTSPRTLLYDWHGCNLQLLGQFGLTDLTVAGRRVVRTANESGSLYSTEPQLVTLTPL